MLHLSEVSKCKFASFLKYKAILAQFQLFFNEIFENFLNLKFMVDIR